MNEAPDPAKDKLLWLRDHCKQKAGWHRSQAKKWSRSVNPAHEEKVIWEKAWEDHWQKTADELEKVIQAAIQEAVMILRNQA